MRPEELASRARSPEQAQKIISVSKRLGCWPDDTTISPEVPEDGALIAVVGRRKGRPKTMIVEPDGSLRHLS